MDTIEDEPGQVAPVADAAKDPEDEQASAVKQRTEKAAAVKQHMFEIESSDEETKAPKDKKAQMLAILQKRLQVLHALKAQKKLRRFMPNSNYIIRSRACPSSGNDCMRAQLCQSQCPRLLHLQIPVS